MANHDSSIREHIILAKKRDHTEMPQVDGIMSKTLQQEHGYKIPDR